MGGFYGNISDTAKTTFSFDIIYENRTKMDEQADQDGVFLGRYVLIDYDEAPIKGYARRGTDGSVISFHSSTNFTVATQIISKTNTIYEDISSNTQYDNKFYRYNSNTRQFEKLTLNDQNPYYNRFEQDVSKYGRGYDSTVWVKHYDDITHTYKYAMIAELNAVVPTLHLVSQAPNTVPLTPYFDRDTTNIDYYLHMQSDFGTRLKPIQKLKDKGFEIRSDETANYITVEKNVDNSGYTTFTPKVIENESADIYYNNAGFDVNQHNYSEGTVTYPLYDDFGQQIAGKTKTVDYSKNHIGYDMGRSGRLYGANADMGVYTEGSPADDIYDWFIRLPGIGNAICKMWDKVYGYREDNKRYLNDALTYQDNTRDSGNLVSYDRNTMIGVMNTAQDLIGYHFIETTEENLPGKLTWPTEAKIMPEDFYITVDVNYGSGISADSATYEKLKCIFYTVDEDGNKKYYAYKYNPNYGNPVQPEFTDDTRTTFANNLVYYYKENGIYHVANPKTYRTTDADGNAIASTYEYYLATPEWTIESINGIADNSIQTLIAQIHTMLGTNIGEIRDMNSIQGAINTMKDIIANIDINLAPGRLLHTNNSGIIETVEGTYFPSATWDRDEVLDGAGRWVSRFATVKVLGNSSNDNQKNPEVNAIVGGVEQNVATVIESDNDKSHYGTALVNDKKHTANNLTLGSRNKWIELYGNPDTDSIEFKHSQSPIITRLRAEQAEGSSYVDMFNGVTEEGNVILEDSTGFTNFSVNEKATEIKVEPTTDKLEYKSSIADQNDNRLTIPYMTVDNAGHVVELGVKNYNIPHGFKKVSTTTVEDSNEDSSSNQAGISIAENITDTLHISQQNRWIDIATVANNEIEGVEEEDVKQDQITFGHRLIHDLSKVNDKREDNITDILNGKRRSSKDAIPTVYRFGLPQDKSIADLDEDFGGYDKDNNKIVDPELIREKANTFNVPYIEIDKAGHVVAAETHTVQLPENFTTITLSSQSENTKVEADIVTVDTTLAADTLTDNLTLATTNRWIGMGLNPEADEVTFGHRLSDIKDVKELPLNGDRRANEKYTNVYRYGLPQDKSVTDLDEDFGGYDEDNNKITDPELIREQANTFNVPYIEIDEAGHIVHAETHTVAIPDVYTTIVVGEASDSTGEPSTKGEAGVTADELAKATTMTADTLAESLTFNSSNKWIRISGDDTKGKDTIEIGHEIHNIIASSSKEDLEVIANDDSRTQKSTFATQQVAWDNAGHIISHHTTTWTLPDSIHNIAIGAEASKDAIKDLESASKTITADDTFDTVTLIPGNIWTKMAAYPADNKIAIGHLVRSIATSTQEIKLNNHSSFDTYDFTYDEAGHILSKTVNTLTLPQMAADETWILKADAEAGNLTTFSHKQQGTAGSHGSNVSIIEFGGSANLQGYKVDAAGHIIEYPTYTLTIPKGSYHEIESNGANVLTSLSFTDNTGALVGSKTNIGDLLLTGYTTANIASEAIAATDSLNKAVAKIEAQILKEQADRIKAVTAEEQARIKAVGDEVKARADADTLLQENIDKEKEAREAADKTLSDKIDKEIEDRKTAISEETSARAKADEDEIAARDKAITDAVQALWQDLLQNYNLVLTPPTINSISKTAIDSNYSVQLVANITAIEGDTYSYSWNTGETGNTIEVTTAGIYTCTVTRTHNGYTSTSSKDIEVLESEIPVPVIPEEPVEPQPEEPIV